jgi:hypothetical protein
VRCAGERPLRFIIWSWPSDAIRGPVQDARVKADRTVPAAYYLAWFVDKLNPEAPLGLWGHSFGARIITGALHVLGGGHLHGTPSLIRTNEPRAQANVVLAAAAVDNDWLLAGHAHSLALSQVDRLLLLNNRCDPVLKRYHRLYHRRACQLALGYAGLPAGLLDVDARSKVQQVDVCCQIGHEHALAGYLCSSNLMALVRGLLLAEPSSGPQTADEAEPNGPLLAVEP